MTKPISTQGENIDTKEADFDEMSIIKDKMQPLSSKEIEKYIWYACYGSNLSYERFMKYINNCSDSTPPQKWMPITIKHDMYFARESRTWENKGVAFLNPEESSNAYTLGKMYLIKLEQYLEVKEQEGRMYTNELCLGYFDNKKIVTFTDTKVYPKNEPSEKYLNVISKGLLDSYPSLPDYDIWEYLKSR